MTTKCNVGFWTEQEQRKRTVLGTLVKFESGLYFGQ